MKNINDDIMDELPCYADMVDLITRFKKSVSPSEQYKIDNILECLKLSATLITCGTDEVEAQTIDEINSLLR